MTEFSRAAAGLAGAGLGAAFVLRAGGDLASPQGSTLSWLSPLGWAQQTAPFVLDRWWPLSLVLGFAVVTVSVGFVLADRRDLAASLFAVRPGPSNASDALETPLGLALRLQRASILGWAASLFVAGLLFGAFADALVAAFAAARTSGRSPSPTSVTLRRCSWYWVSHRCCSVGSPARSPWRGAWSATA